MATIGVFILCQIKGGVHDGVQFTVQEDGKTLFYDDELQAKSKIGDLNDRMNHPRCSCHFEYAVVKPVLKLPVRKKS